MWNILEGEKIPTHLKVHLKSSHREANLAYLVKVQDCTQAPSPETQAAPRPGSVTEHKTTIG